MNCARIEEKTAEGKSQREISKRRVDPMKWPSMSGERIVCEAKVPLFRFARVSALTIWMTGRMGGTVLCTYK